MKTATANEKKMDERYPERNIQRAKDALYKAYIDSEKSLEECIELILNPEITDYL